MRRFALVLLIGVVAGCGATKKSAPPPAMTGDSTATAPSPSTAVPGSRALYAGGSWAVILVGERAVAVHLVRGAWKPDRSGRVRIAILGPQPGHQTVSLPQIAVELTAKAPLAESGLWVDGKELNVQGGGTPTRGTIYGAPAGDLRPGRHTAVAYGRTATTGTAVAWSFTSR